MGNCLKHKSSTKYATKDDDGEWDFSAFEGNFAGKSNGAASKTTTEVKIKITKKQLEELLSKVDMKELRVEQVLAQLMNHSNHFRDLGDLHFRASLKLIEFQSIDQLGESCFLLIEKILY